MATKFKVSYSVDKNNDYVWQSLGISEKRADDLNYRMQLIIHDCTRPVKKGEQSPGSDVLVKLFLALAEDTQELAFVAYSAGTAVPQIFDTEEDDDDFDRPE